MKRKGLNTMVVGIVVLGVLSLGFVGAGLMTDFSFSTLFGPSIEDCEGDVITSTLEGFDSVESYEQQLGEKIGEENASKVVDQNNLRMEDGEVKYDACTSA